MIRFGLTALTALAVSGCEKPASYARKAPAASQKQAEPSPAGITMSGDIRIGLVRLD